MTEHQKAIVNFKISLTKNLDPEILSRQIFYLAKREAMKKYA